MACSVTRPLPNRQVKALDQLIIDSPIFSKSFTGFVLYDPASKSTLYSQHADKYFTPASNTKIFTLYTATQYLSDSLPVLNYKLIGDSLYFWGTGNPAFLHHYLPQDGRVFTFLQQHRGPLFYSDHNFKDEHFGSGWAWDDYTYAFQAEKSSFPIYGNVVQFHRDSLMDSNQIQVTPPLFKKALHANASLYDESPSFLRQTSRNTFEHNKKALTEAAYNINKPFITNSQLICQLLSDTLKQRIQLAQQPAETFDNNASLQVPFPDTLYQLLMKDSDNFVAEQLILMCADRQVGFIQTDTLIRKAKQELFAGAPDELLWYDGSGLTRYNMFTPRTVIFVLDKLLAENEAKWLHSIFPGGGQAGTISEWYGDNGEPFIYAKTGTLRNKHCLSGYIVTDSGKTLIFSFMHNNFPTGSAPLKAEMEKVLLWIKQAL